jgi:general secretion pathway protein D
MKISRNLSNRLTAFVVACTVAIAIVLWPGLEHAAFAATDGGEERLVLNDQTGRVRIDFDDAGITVIIDAISRLTGKNFIYDDRVRGKVTIISPSPVTVEEAWAVFESVLKIKGFTAIPGPAGVLKIVPVRDAKESNIETIHDGRESANRDQYVTRMIPLYYIDAQAITNTLKPLISKDAAVVVYAPTNTIILTDTKANIRRILGILAALDVETHKQELAVIKVLYADADTLGGQITDIYGGKATGGKATARSARKDRSSRRSKSSSAASLGGGLQTAQHGEVRIITESRTNSLLILASRSQISEIRDLIHKLDVPVVGGGKIHVYYLKHADAQEMAKTLNDLVSGSGGRSGGRTGKAGAQPSALRSVVTPLAEGQIRLSADPATNSLVIQASKEAYETLIQVIEKLDVPRPQVLVEALIMEIDITDESELGTTLGYSILNNKASISFSGQDAISTLAAFPLASIFKSSIETNDDGTQSNGRSFSATIQAAARDNRVKILSSPHILTSDNEQAEIRIGDNIPIVTSRVQAATGSTTNGLSSSVNIERKDIGVTLRVTPQISDGNTLRLQIYQEITEVNQALSVQVAGGTAEGTTDVGVALSNRFVENTVVVADGDTVVIGGLIGETTGTTENKVPFLGDIPIIGWLFKSTSETTRRTNLIIMLTPHIIRNPADLESESIYRRNDFTHATDIHAEIARLAGDVMDGSDNVNPRSQVEERLLDHTLRYPAERINEIDRGRVAARFAEIQRRAAELDGPRYMIHAVVTHDDNAAQKVIQIIDLGYEATLVSHVAGDGGVVLEIQAGPFESMQQAESALTILHRSMHLDPYMVVVDPAEVSDDTMLAPEPEDAP